MNLSKKTTVVDQEELNCLLQKFKFPVTLISGKNFHGMFLQGMGEKEYQKSKKVINDIAGLCYSNLPPLTDFPDYLDENHVAALNFDCIEQTAKKYSRKGCSLSVIDLCKIQVLVVASHEMGHTQYKEHCSDPSCLFGEDNSAISRIDKNQIYICCPCTKHPIKQFNHVKKMLSVQHGNKLVWGDSKAKRNWFIECTRP